MALVLGSFEDDRGRCGEMLRNGDSEIRGESSPHHDASSKSRNDHRSTLRLSKSDLIFSVKVVVCLIAVVQVEAINAAGHPLYLPPFAGQIPLFLVLMTAPVWRMPKLRTKHKNPK